MEAWRTGGFLNYFGLQRFGTHNTGTHSIGEAILRREWEEAVDRLLGKPSVDDKDPAVCVGGVWVGRRCSVWVRVVMV
jgi:tRNA(Glu) U13 pseudouridine synthase TruD